MPRYFLLVFALLISLVSGCAIPHTASDDQIEAKGKELSSQSSSKIVTVLNEPYLGAQPIRLPKETAFTTGVFTRHISLNKRGTLKEIAATVTEMTGLPITVVGAVKGSGGASGSSSGAARNLDKELHAALGGGAVPTQPQSSAPTAPVGFRIKYAGTVKGLLDALAARTGLSWEYTPDTGVVFSSATMKTFTIHAAPGKITFSNKITNQSKEQGNSSSGGGSYQDSSIETAQVNTSELSFDIWKDVENEVKHMLTGSGTVSINQAAGTLTVSDTPASIHRVSKYVSDLNERLSRQLALSIKVWSLEIENSGEAGVDLRLFFENPSVKVFAGASPLKFLNAGGELSAAIVDGKLKNSTALLKGLSKVGKASQVTSGGGVVMSGQPIPVQAIRREAYLASSSRTQGEYGDTTELVPGEVTTGFAMTVIPHILENRRVVLQYTVNLSNLDDITEFKSGDSTIQLPKVSTRSFAQRMTLKMGQTLVLAGFEQELEGKSSSGGLLGFGKSREYTKSLIVITISTEVGDV